MGSVREASIYVSIRTSYRFSLRLQVSGVVFAVLLSVFFLEDAEGFAGQIWAKNVLRIKNSPKFLVLNQIQE